MARDLNMNFNEKVSVVVPVYNAEKHLEKCIYSILNQTYDNIEVILIDDGSVDRSYEICENIAGHDKRILVYKQENKGCLAARKAGVECANGKFVMTVDSDDWIERNMIEELMHYMSKYDVDIVLSGIYYDYAQKEMNTVWLDGVTLGFHDLKDIDSEIFEHFFLEKGGEYNGRGLRGHVCTRLFKKNLIRNVMNQIDTRIKNGEDDACLYSAVLSSESIYVLDKAFYHYCVHDNSMCQNSDNRSLIDVELLGEYLQGHVERHFAKEKLIKQLNKYMYLEAKGTAQRIYRIKEANRYLFPFNFLPLKCKVVIYGAGKVGKEYIKYLSNSKQYELTAWIDRKVNEKENVQELSAINSIEYDYILLAAASRQTAASMRASISEYVDNLQTVLWEKPLINCEDIFCEM